MNRDEYRILWNEIIGFVDDFRRNPSLDKLIERNHYTNETANAFYAGVVEKLADEQNMTVPEWVFQEKYYLPEPVFLGGLKGEYRIYIMLETPLAFKIRNIFVGENILYRC
jgi:hypothetical protein